MTAVVARSIASLVVEEAYIAAPVEEAVVAYTVVSLAAIVASLAVQEVVVPTNIRNRG